MSNTFYVVAADNCSTIQGVTFPVSNQPKSPPVDRPHAEIDSLNQSEVDDISVASGRARIKASDGSSIKKVSVGGQEHAERLIQDRDRLEAERNNMWRWAHDHCEVECDHCDELVPARSCAEYLWPTELREQPAATCHECGLKQMAEWEAQEAKEAAAIQNDTCSHCGYYVCQCNRDHDMQEYQCMLFADHLADLAEEWRDKYCSEALADLR